MRKSGKNTIGWLKYKEKEEATKKVFKDMDHRRLQKADDEEEGDSDREFCLSSSRNWATSNLWQASDPLGMSRL
ncbi:unnamed protein product [Brassica oleracea var. botrytis]|uniref:(rape) hypothetical protein n=1 Tax=Brassica napus TaxID=3708 RepID=A0A816LCA1_BRANA|nr:unnamed protein product [Brassica napus]